MRQEMLGFWDAVASAGPYAKKICTSLQTDNHTNASSLNFYTLNRRHASSYVIHTHTRLTALFPGLPFVQDYPAEPVPER